jgi:hypothetical protein
VPESVLLLLEADPGTESGMTEEDDFLSEITEEEDDFLSFWRLEEVLESPDDRIKSMRLLEDFLVLLLVIPAEVPESVLLLQEADPGTESGMTEEDDDSSSFTDVLLSSPQATRAMVNKRTMMDPITLRVPG